MKVHLIRHAVVKQNKNRCFIGVTNSPLSKKGKAACKTYSFPIVQAVFASPLARCIQTANLIYPQLEPIIDPDLQECNFGIFEGKNHNQLKENQDYQIWLKEEGKQPPPAGEGWEEFSSRCAAGLIRLVQHSLDAGLTEVAAITHGGVILSIMEKFGRPCRELYAWQADNLGGWTLILEPHVWKQDQSAYALPLERRKQDV